MIQARALEPSPDLCCLPSPHRIPQGVAGMAFNFSKIEISSRSRNPRRHRPYARSTEVSPAIQSGGNKNEGRIHNGMRPIVFL